MANNNNEGVNTNSDSSKESGLDKSFVGKFVSGLLNNTPLSKWFGKESPKSVVRRRDDDDDDEDASYIFQPPVKRAKLPSNSEHNNYSAHLFESPVTVHNASNNVNNVSSKVFGKFPEPVAGPSGITSRKLFEKHNSTASTNTVSSTFESQNVVNGENDSDSEESTSGYCSTFKPADKEVVESTKTVNKTDVCEKTTPKTRSLFASTDEPSHSRTFFAEKSPQMNTSLSSRRPAFNASTFGSPNFVDRTLSTKNILNSPFYNGHTIYGGASAYGRRLGRSAEDLNNSTRASVQIKPVNEKMPSDNTTLSKTARRILSTLEQYSTPISDAKKIPVTPKKQGILSKYIGATPYSMREREKKRPSNRELQVPTIPELLQMKQKEKLQNSTVAVRQLATTSKSVLNKEEYKLRTEDDNKQKYSNKMKSNVSSLRQKAPPTDEPVSDPKLPKVSLPITTLPKFDFVLMPPQSSSEANKNSPSVTYSQANSKSENRSLSVAFEKKETEKKPVENGKTIFTFSEPLVISKDLKAVSAINCFKFSEPVCKKQCVDGSIGFKSGDANRNFTGFKMKNNGENIKPASQLLAGSVMDVLRKKDETSTSTNLGNKHQGQKAKWECQTCLVKNDIDKEKCVACHEPKPKPEIDSKKGFGDHFKSTKDTWECSSCMVRNNNRDKNCVCCGTAKPGDKPKTEDLQKSASMWKCTNCLISNKEGVDKCTSCGVSKSEKKSITNFGDKFKPSGDTWECSVCMIRNKNTLDKCEACQTPKVKPKTPQKIVRFEDQFKLPTNTWECPTCMIRNKNDVVKCPACETMKPGEKAVAPPSIVSSTTFTFGIPAEWECKSCLVKNKNELTKCAACGSLKENKNLDKKGFGDVFKIKEGEWDCTSCMVRNKGSASVCTCCGVSKPGSTSEKPPETGKDENKPSLGFNFGIDKSTPMMFKFGIPPPKSETKDSTSSTTITTSAPSFTSTPTTTPTLPVLASTPISVSSAAAPTLVPTPASTTTSTPGLTFMFGDPSKSTAATTSGFTFGIGTREKSASDKSITSTSETSTTVSSNPLLKPNEKLPEKVMPAPVGFSLGQKTISSESSITSTSKTDAPVIFSSSFESVKPTIPTPTFQFKPTTINGDVSKSKESPFASKLSESSNLFSSKPTESNIFAKPSENTNLFTSKPAEGSNLFSSKPSDGSTLFQSKPVDMFSIKPVENTNMFASKPAESNNLFANKPTDSTNIFSSKPTESGNLFTSKPAENNLFSSKPVDSSNLFSSKPPESNNLFSSKPPEGNNLFANKPVDSGNLFSNKPAESSNLFSSKPADSSNPFASKPADGNNLFTNKPTEGNNLFANKPAEGNNLFANKSADTTNLFGGKPAESNNLFSTKPADSSGGLFSNKPAETNLFANKPADSGSLFSNTALTPTFKFNVKPTENATSTASTISQPEVNSPGLFKFGTDTSQTVMTMKKFGESNDNVSNGFGTVPKIPAFGTPHQPFGATENKPFAFGTTDSTPKSTGFSFGQPQQQPPQPPQPEKPMTTPVFSFGSATSGTPSSGFSFPSPSSGFNFGGTGKIDNKPFGTPSNVFGAGAPGANNGSFNFGTSSNNNNQKAIFTFGASQTNQPQPSFPTQNQSGFNFGMAAPPTGPTGGFSFTGAPPSFSFTDGIPSTAQPPPRKIKKALRRTPR